MKLFRRLIQSTAAIALSVSLFAAPAQAVIAQAQIADDLFAVYNQNALHLKFSESTDVTLVDGQFVSETGKDLSQINAVLSGTDKQALIPESKPVLEAVEAEAEAESGELIADLSTYFRITTAGNAKVLSDQLENLPYILEAYPEPLPARSPSAPDFSSQQAHFKNAPLGMGIDAAADQPGIKGNKVTVADLEYSWNIDHEDLSDARAAGASLPVGTPMDPWNDTNHGTAVAGILVGDVNSYGINGIVPDAELKMVNTYGSGGWNIAAAVYMAQTNLKKGDVILIEQQVWGPNGSEMVPAEWVPAVYDAIKTATSKGIIVVEAAGNSGVNLDNPIYGAKFPLDKKDSGAIIVGAGAACTQAPRSRMSYSNYGKRVNLQAHAECVVTSGYGALYWQGPNETYTNNFAGTSSASAIVAGIAAAFSSAFEAENNTPAKPAYVRSTLKSTGKAQDKSVPGNIGKQPDLKAALKKIDGTKPTKPGSFTATVNADNHVVMNWTASSDKYGIKHYLVQRDGKTIATTTSLNYTDTTAVAGRTYKYKVQAVDGNNLKNASKTITLTIPL